MICLGEDLTDAMKMGSHQLHRLLDIGCFQVCIHDKIAQLPKELKSRSIDLTINSAATWQFASGIIAIGLTWRESIAIVAVGFFLVSIVIAFNGTQFPIHSQQQAHHPPTYLPLDNRCHGSTLPRPLPRPRQSLLGFLGLLHRHHLPRHPSHLLVRHPDHEWSQHRARHARRHLALLPDPRELDSGKPGHRDEYHGQFLPVLVGADTLLVYAPE